MSRKITFLVREFSLGKPAQQLVDRLLMGYARDGEFHKFEDVEFTLHVEGNVESKELAARAEKNGLRLAKSSEEALSRADAVLLVGDATAATEERVSAALGSLRPNTCCFIYGRVPASEESALRLKDLVRSRQLLVASGNATGTAFRLPDIDLPRTSGLKKSLIVAPGTGLEAEWDALEGLIPLIERRRNVGLGVNDVRLLKGDALWNALDNNEWKHLLAAAISRSNTIQGDPMRDGRTQDVVGQGLIKTLAKEPRGWSLQHADGLRTMVLILNGVLTDVNFALELAGGEIKSAQLYRPPAPVQEHFSRLATTIEDFFVSRKVPWSFDRSILVSGLLGRFEKALAG